MNLKLKDCDRKAVEKAETLINHFEEKVSLVKPKKWGQREQDWQEEPFELENSVKNEIISKVLKLIASELADKERIEKGEEADTFEKDLLR